MSRCVVYLCRHSAAEALAGLKRDGYVVPGGIECRETACGGRVGSIDLLKDLENGAAAVAVIMCHQDACTHLHGNSRCGKRIAHVRGLLTEAGLDSERVREYRISNVQGFRMKEIIDELINSKHEIRNSKQKGKLQ